MNYQTGKRYDAPSIFDSPELALFMQTAFVSQRGKVTLYLSERRMTENAMVAPPDGEYKRASDGATQIGD